MFPMKKTAWSKLICVFLILAALLPWAAAEAPVRQASVFSELTGGTMTLGEFATYCVYAFELGGQDPAENPFTDVEPGTAAGDNILRLTARGVLKGYPDGTVRPDEIVSRTRAFTILTRLLTSFGGRVPAVQTLPPNVTAAMCSADFWLAGVSDCGRVLLSPEEITALDQKILTEKSTNMFDLENLPETYSGTMAAELAAFETPSAHYLNGQEMDEGYYQKLRDNANNPAVPAEAPIRYGFAVNRTVLRGLPTTDALTSSLANPEEDDFALTGIAVAEPLVLYHATVDGSMTYAFCDHCCGWIPTADIAVCADKAQWLEMKNPEQFLVVTGEKVYLEPCGDKTLHEKMLPMGTKLPLVAEPEKSVTWRSPMNNYTVWMPARQEDGSFTRIPALIPANRAVSVGYPAYTTDNLLRIAFGCLGNRYSWGGGIDGLDCSLYVHDVYRCFGIALPRNTTWQSAVPTEKSLDWTGKTAEEKCADLDRLRPGAILIWSAHEVLYLGKYDGKYYVINDVGKFADPNHPEEGVISVYGVVVNDLSVQRANGATWLDSLTHVTVIE